MIRDVLQGTSVCSRITRLTQPNKSQTRNHIPKRRGSDDKNTVAIVKIVSQLGCLSHDSESLDFRRGKQAGETRFKVLGPIRRIRFTQSTLHQASIVEKEGPPLGKMNAKLPHQRSPYSMKFEDKSREETERQQRCARSRAWNFDPKHLQAQRRRHGCISSFPRRNGNSWLRQQRAVGKRVCGRFWSEYAHGQEERPQFCWVGDHEDIEESNDGDDGQRRGANKRRSMRKVFSSKFYLGKGLFWSVYVDEIKLKRALVQHGKYS